MTARPLRVLFVDHSGTPGGGQLGLLRFLSSDLAIDAHVAFYAGGEVADILTERGVRSRVLSTSQAKWAYFLLAPKLSRVIRGGDFDVVVANSVKAASLLALVPKPRGTRFVYYLRDDMNRNRLSAARWHYLAKAVLPRFDGYLANSEWTASTIPTALAGRPVRIAFPVSGSADEQAVAEHVPRADTLRLVSLSRLARWKGIHVLIDALDLLERRGLGDRVSTTIVGGSLFEDADYEPELRRHAEALSTKIEFTGHISDVTPRLADADVLVSCSVTPEPFGQVIIQGLSHGLVVVATDQGGPREIIENGVNGMLVAPGDAGQLADVLAGLIEDRNEVESIGRAAVERARRFADSRTVPELERAITELNEAFRADARTSAVR